MANDKLEKKPVAKKEAKPNVFIRFKRYMKEVVGELKKLTMPTRKELISYTLTVMAFIVLMAVIIGVLDFAFSNGLRLLGSL